MARTREKDAASRAEALLDEMIHRLGGGDNMPETFFSSDATVSDRDKQEVVIHMIDGTKKPAEFGVVLPELLESDEYHHRVNLPLERIFTTRCILGHHSKYVGRGSKQNHSFCE